MAPLYFYYRTKYKFAKHLPLKTPIDVSLELSSFCNQRCVYCYHADPKNLPFVKQHMSFETAKKIIDSAAECGVHSLKFNWRGEPTLNPEFSKILHYAKSKAHGLTFIDRITNSNFNFDPDNIFILEALACQTLVKVSIDSFYKQVMDRQRPGHNLYRALANLYRFYKWPGRKTKIVVQAVKTDLNKKEDHRKFLDRTFKEVGLSVRDVVSGRVAVEAKEGQRVPCHQAFYRLVYDAEGNAHACCNDIRGLVDLGNINSMSVRESFNCASYRALRNGLKSGLEFTRQPCSVCPSFESFDGWEPQWMP